MVSKTSAGHEPLPLACSVMHYAWGSGPDGMVSRLCGNTSGQRCAELWMGTHPAGPSRLRSPPNALLSSCLDSGRQQLPFLFKVLSVGKALSIQAHPDRRLAQELHAKDPQNYPDGNHKPEMAIALEGPFEALCSFRQEHQIRGLWDEFPALGLLAPPGSVRDMFAQIMTADGDRAGAVAERLLGMDPPLGEPGELLAVFRRLWRDYPDDVGCFCVFVLNHVRLAAGQAIFLGANEPHCYLSGDCIECMAASDNVVRAGLTPKHRDLPTLLGMLTYRQVSADDLIIRPLAGKEGLSAYRANGADEFMVLSGNVAKDGVLELQIARDALVIFICGSGAIGPEPYAAGSVFYLPPGAGHVIRADESSLFYCATEP